MLPDELGGSYDPIPPPRDEQYEPYFPEFHIETNFCLGACCYSPLTEFDEEITGFTVVDLAKAMTPEELGEFLECLSIGAQE